MSRVGPYPNVSSVANDILSVAAAHRGRRYSARPWNRHQPETCLWWVVPATTWPAYAHGKVVISPDRPGNLFIGLVAEKGLDPVVRSVYRVSESLIIDGDWCWNHLIRGMSEGAVDGAVAEIGANTDLPVSLKIEAAYVSEPSDFSPYDDNDITRDTVAWEFGDSTLTVVRPPTGFLSPLAGVSCAADLPEQLERVDGLGWMWIDCYIGVDLLFVPGGEPEPGHWNGLQIWDRVLAPLEQWLI